MKLMSSQRRPVLILFVLVAIASSAVLAQSTTSGAIAGMVTDQSRAVVPNAAVTVLNLATHETKTGITDSFGSFRVIALDPGRYEISVEAPSFASYKLVVQVFAHVVQDLASDFRQAQIAERIAEQASHQEFHRKIVETLCPGLAVTSLRLKHAVDQLIAHRQ